jgi:hypothetical protein
MSKGNRYHRPAHPEGPKKSAPGTKKARPEKETPSPGRRKPTSDRRSPRRQGPGGGRGLHPAEGRASVGSRA